MLSALLSLYILLLIALSVYRSKKAKTENAASFLTAGASAGTLLCALSLVSTIIGGSATLGIGTLAQKIGAAAFWWLGHRSVHTRLVDRTGDPLNGSLYITRCVGQARRSNCQTVECLHYRGQLGWGGSGSIYGHANAFGGYFARLSR